MGSRLPISDPAVMKKFFQTGQYSDLAITCRGIPFKLHMEVVCALSGWFAEACDPRSEMYTKPPISLDEDLVTLQNMFEWMYTGSYKEETSGDSHNDNPGALIETKKPAAFQTVRVYALACKYLVPTLKEYARERFEKWCEQNWNHEDFHEFLKEVCRPTVNNDGRLREFAAGVCAERALQMLSPDEKGFRDVAGDIGVDIMKYMMSMLGEHKKATEEFLLEERNLLLDEKKVLEKQLAMERSKFEKEIEILEDLRAKEQKDFLERLEKGRVGRASVNAGITRKIEKIKELEGQLEAQRKIAQTKQTAKSAKTQPAQTTKKTEDTEMEKRLRLLSIQLTKSSQSHKWKSDKIRNLETDLHKAEVQNDQLSKRLNDLEAKHVKAHQEAGRLKHAVEVLQDEKEKVKNDLQAFKSTMG